MASSGSVWFDLADGTSVSVERDDVRQVYDELWALTNVQGAISTAALLLEEAGRHHHYRQGITLNGAQSSALRSALDQLANP